MTKTEQVIPTSEVKMNMCIHEAGHVVVGCLLGLHIHGVQRTECGLGVPACAPEHPTQLESKTLAIWSMAGAAAERRADCFDPAGCISDFDAACFLMKDHLDDPSLDGSKLVTEVTNVEAIASAILGASWDTVVTMAAAIMEAGGDLSEEAMLEAMRNTHAQDHGDP